MTTNYEPIPSPCLLSSMESVANTIRSEFGIDLTRPELFKLLRKNGILGSDNWPTPKYDSGHYFRVQTILKGRFKHLCSALRVFPKGIDLIRKMIMREYKVTPLPFHEEYDEDTKWTSLTMPSTKEIQLQCALNRKAIQRRNRQMKRDKTKDARMLEKKKVNLFAECRDIAEDDNILDMFIKTLSKIGLVGEQKIIKLLYLCLCTRFLPQLVSAVIKGASSTGKSHIVKTILKFFPKSAYHVLTSMSDKALIYSGHSFRNKFLVIHELQGMKTTMLDYFIRALLSEGKINYEATGKGPSTKEGPTGLITTTTEITLHPENETRCLSLEIDDSEEQTKRILKDLAEQAATGRTYCGDEDIKNMAKPWIYFQKWVKLAEHRVLIPFAPAISDLIPPAATRIRRDFSKITDLIKAHAIIHQMNRKTDSKGRIIASFKDYMRVRTLLNDTLSMSADVKVSDQVMEVVGAVADMLETDSQHNSVSMSEIAQTLKVNKSTISRIIKVAVEKGYLVNAESRKGRSAQLSLGDELPTTNGILPKTKEVKRIHQQMKDEKEI
jgi:hypothetical protein